MKPLSVFTPNTHKRVLCLVESQAELRNARLALDEELQKTHDVQRIPGPVPEPGADAYEAHLEWLTLHDTALRSFDKILLCFADDAKRRRYCEALIGHLGVARCWRPALPGGTVTLTGVLEEHGLDMVTRAIALAEPWPPVGIVRLDELMSDILAARTQSVDYGVSTGIACLDEYYRVRQGEFTIVHGIPYHGKSTFMTAMMAHLINREHWKFVVYSPEYYSLADFVSQVIEHVFHRPYTPTTLPDGTKVPGIDVEDIDRAVRFLREYLFFLRPPDEDTALALPDMLDMIRTLDDQYGIDGVIIDPYNEMDHKRPAYETETEYISRQMTLLRKLARLRRMHIWLVAHPTKLRKAESGQYKGHYPPPGQYDIAGSAAFYSKPDNILAVWRDLMRVTEQEIHVQKVRHRHAGRMGMAKTNYDPLRFRYEAVFDERSYDV